MTRSQTVRLLASSRAWAVAAASGSALGATALLLHTQRSTNEEAAKLPTAARASPPVNWDAATLVWGSNKNRLIAPQTSPAELVRTPTVRPDFTLPPLRDLALYESHGALVDCRGDVFQWGDAHFGEIHAELENREPMSSLVGKDIVKIALGDEKLYALSRSGKVYILPVKRTVQRQGLEKSGWFAWLFGSPTVHHAELKPDAGLGWGEKFASISAGKHHLLAVTSTGRVFAHPITLLANSFGQLGLRKVQLSHPTTANQTLNVLLDANGASQPPITPQASEATSPTKIPTLSDSSIHFCEKLFEIPSLKDIKIAQAVAGDRSSFARTADEGRVLAWGANDFGQLGVGTQISLPFVTVPTEVILSRFCPIGTRATCTDIVAGGDLTYFVVRRASPGKEAVIDVLSSGRGQWGGLGSGSFSSAQSEPLRVRAISGLTEYSESLKRMEPIGIHSLAVSSASSGHALLTLDTLAQSGPGTVPRRDLYVWGNNQSCQLGNGSKKNLAVPTNIFDPERELGAPDGRAMLGEKEARVVDMQGNLWKKKARLEQVVVAGRECTIAYWKIVDA